MDALSSRIFNAALENLGRVVSNVNEREPGSASHHTLKVSKQFGSAFAKFQKSETGVQKKIALKTVQHV